MKITEKSETTVLHTNKTNKDIDFNFKWHSECCKVNVSQLHVLKSS